MSTPPEHFHGPVNPLNVWMHPLNVAALCVEIVEGSDLLEDVITQAIPYSTVTRVLLRKDNLASHRTVPY
jgi:hypothetical protein